MNVATFAKKEMTRSLDEVIAQWEKALDDLQAARLAVNGDTNDDLPDAIKHVATVAMVSGSESFRELGVSAAAKVGMAARLLTAQFDSLGDADGEGLIVGNDAVVDMLNDLFASSPDEESKRDFDGNVE